MLKRKKEALATSPSKKTTTMENVIGQNTGSYMNRRFWVGYFWW